MSIQEIAQLDPSALTIDANVRSEAALNAGFIASIKTHGVIVPVVAHRTEDGTVHVLMGQRRTLAAIEAGLVTIPVHLVDSLEEAQRLAQQVVENDQRQELTAGDRAEAFHQMSLLGISAAKIAKETGTTKTVVEKGLKARSTDAGTKALQDGLDFDAALILAEFADSEDDTAEIESVLADEPSQLQHVAQIIRNRREEEAELAKTVASYEAAGKIVVDSIGNYEGEDNIQPRYLLDAAGNPVPNESANGVHLSQNWRGDLVVTGVVVGWKELGYTPTLKRYEAAAKAELTEEEREEKKAERRTLIARNKEMEAATIVRREWVKNLLGRKTAPKGWQHFCTLSMLNHHDVGRDYDPSTAAELAGVKNDPEDMSWGYNPLRDHVATTTTRAEFALIAMVAASFEKRLPKDSWRSPTRSGRDYLNQLVEWGYTPSEVENIIINSSIDVDVAISL